MSKNRDNLYWDFLILLVIPLVTVILLKERDYYALLANFIPLESAGNERSFYRLTEFIAASKGISWWHFPESRFYLLYLTVCRTIFGSEWFFMATLIQSYFAYYTYKKYLRSVSPLYNIVVFIGLMTYSVVLLRDIWVIIFAILALNKASQRQWLLALVFLIISLDLRLFTGLLLLFYLVSECIKVNMWRISLFLIFSYVVISQLPFEDFWTTYSKYREREIMEIQNGGVTSALSTVFGSYWAVRFTYLLSPVPTLFLQMGSLYAAIRGIGSLVLFYWLPRFFRGSWSSIVVIAVIGLTSAEIRHKTVFIYLLLYESVRDN